MEQTWVYCFDLQCLAFFMFRMLQKCKSFQKNAVDKHIARYAAILIIGILVYIWMNGFNKRCKHIKFILIFILIDRSRWIRITRERLLLK